MNNKDIRQLSMIYENKLYDGEWKANIVEGSLPEGEHLAYQSGYNLKIGDNEAKLDHGIRGKNFPHNARVVGDVVFLSYVQK